MRSRIHKWWFSFCLLSLFVPGIVLAIAQAQSQTQTPPRIGDMNPQTPDEEESRSRLEKEMAKKAAKERVAALKHDTDKLLKLSVELKESVDKSDENVLSVDVIKKAEEIEKLAHSVKEKMKGPN